MAGSQLENGVQVVTILDDHTYELDEDKLASILLHPDVRDKPVAVVSVAGTFRTGKSFLLDFLLRYCKATLDDRKNKKWLGGENDPLEGFLWRGGSEKATHGIQLWPEPLHLVLPTGKEVVVILMDTQGTFDSSSTVRDCSTIFALSTLLSSVAIYNIVGNIKEYDLQHLQLFTRYGILAKEHEGTPFQVLLFLVRDWTIPYEHSYGVAGGKALLEKRLEVHEKHHRDLRTIREHLRSCFEEIICFLMPHPGLNIAKPTFKGHLADLLPEFRESLETLLPVIFEEYLSPKIINGAELKGRDFFYYFKAYISIFSSDELPEPVTILQATASVNLIVATRNANEVYENYMDDRCNTSESSATTEALKDIQTDAIAAATKTFNAKKHLDPEAAQEELTKITKEWATKFLQYAALNKAKLESAINEAKAKYDSIIFRQCDLESLCLHPIDLENDHKEAVSITLKLFDAKRIRKFVFDPERENLIKELQNNLAKLHKLNEKNNVSNLNEAKNIYSDHMTQALGRGTCMSTETLNAHHEVAFQKATEYFTSHRTRYVKRNNDNYLTLLIQALEKQYTRLKTKNEAINSRAVKAAYDIYNSEMKAKCAPSLLSILLCPLVMKITSWIPQYHKNAKSEAIAHFMEKRRPSTQRGVDIYYKLLKSRIVAAYEEYKNPCNALLREIGLRY